MAHRPPLWSLLLPVALGLVACAGSGADYAQHNIESAEVVEQQLVAPPMVPAHEQVASGAPRVVKVRLVIEEKLVTIDAAGTQVWAFTFGGTIPGPMLVAHQYDWFEVTLVNPATNQLVHNVDFHAATGAMGGGSLTMVAPGQEVVLRWQATKPGVFVYHCAPGGPMTPYHVVKAMNGAVMVLPRDGLRDAAGAPIRYDRAYYIGEQDFYLPRGADGAYRQYPNSGADMADMLEVMRTLTPTHVVFNGAEGALTGSAAMAVNVGEKVLFLHTQANRDSRPHIIGGHADLVWQGGSFRDTPLTDQETWFVPGGAGVAALYEFRQNGLYAYVNHNLIEAVLLGAAGHIQAAGEWDDRLMTQVAAPGPIKP